jgi:hypothetical protein
LLLLLYSLSTVCMFYVSNLEGDQTNGEWEYKWLMMGTVFIYKAGKACGGGNPEESSLGPLCSGLFSRMWLTPFERERLWTSNLNMLCRMVKSIQYENFETS